MNFKIYALHILAFLMVVNHGIVLPMENPLDGTMPTRPTSQVPKTDAEKEEAKLSSEERAGLDQEINSIQDTLNAALNETKDIDPDTILNEMNLNEYDKKQKSNTFIPGFENYMSGINETTEAFKKERERAQYQNTILLGHPKSPVALYRRDLMELPFFAADIALGYLFFENLKNKRIEYIYESFREDLPFYIETLTQIKELQKLHQNSSDNKEEIAKLVDLFKQIAEKHSYIGNNPFKLEVVMPFLGTILGYKLSRYIQEQCITKRSFTPEAQYAYTQDENGDYHRFTMEGFFATPNLNDLDNKINNIHKTQDPFKSLMDYELSIFHTFLFPGNAPMSTMGAIKGNFIANPNANPILDQIPDAEQFIPEGLFAKGLYKLAGLPDWLYEVKNSRAARFAIEIAVLATITAQIDAVYQTTWLEYIEKNIDTLLSLLHAYEKVKHLPNNHQEKNAVCKDLLTFIQTGNTCISWKDACFKFFFYKDLGRLTVVQKILSWTSIAAATSLLCKSKSLIKFGITAAKNNMLPPEAWLVGGIVSLYSTLIFGPLLIASAINVYQDVCWAKDKIKDVIKGFFTKENNNKEDTQSEQTNESSTPKEAIS